MSSTGRKITLKSSDGETFEVDEAVALEFQTIKHMIEDDCADGGIPLPNVPSGTLSKVIEYCKKHVEAPKSDDRATSVDDELKVWDADFVKVDPGTLWDLIMAADYLNIKSLIDLTSQALPDPIKGKTPKEIQEIFNKNDFVRTMSSPGRKIGLISSEGNMFVVDEAVALESQMIKDMNACAYNVIPLPNVTSMILSKVIEYCQKHVEAPKSDDRATSVDDELKAWDADFVKVDKATLFNLILAANYLNIKTLFDLTCQTVADMIKAKTPEEIRKTFNRSTNCTPEEQEEIDRENQWAFG